MSVWIYREFSYLRVRADDIEVWSYRFASIGCSLLSRLSRHRGLTSDTSILLKAGPACASPLVKLRMYLSWASYVRNASVPDEHTWDKCSKCDVSILRTGSDFTEKFLLWRVLLSV